jgi:hypothetical protein
MKLDIFFIAITLISSCSHVFALPIPRDIAPIDDIDQLAAREPIYDVDDLVLRQLGAMDGPELEKRLNIGALARVARVVAPKVLKIAKPLVSKVGRFAANGLKRLKGGATHGVRHAPRTGARATGGRPRPRPNARNVGQKLGRSMRTVDRAANHVNNVANAVTNVQNTINSFRKPR